MYLYNLEVPCDVDHFEFVLAAGGGTLNLDEDGFLISYTAPATNPGGVNDPTIQLWCDDELMHEFTLTIEDWCVGDDDQPVTISYTTLQMALNEYQAISLANLKALAPVAEFAFSLAAGDGTLAFDGDGWLTGYTAPATNVDCLKNPTIAVTCHGAPLDSISIAVNGWAGADAYLIKRCQQEWSCEVNEICPIVWIYTGTCAGVETRYYSQWCGGGSESPATDCTFCASIGRGSCAAVALGATCAPVGVPIDTASDTRSAYMKTNGCCPAALL